MMKTLEGPYDFIFMDAAKGQYIHYMPEAVRLLADGGILMSDNVLQDGDIIESRFADKRGILIEDAGIFSKAGDELGEYLKDSPESV